MRTFYVDVYGCVKLKAEDRNDAIQKAIQIFTDTDTHSFSIEIDRVVDKGEEE